MEGSRITVSRAALDGGAALLALLSGWHAWRGFSNLLLLAAPLGTAAGGAFFQGVSLPDGAPFLARFLAAEPAAVFALYFLVSCFTLACSAGILFRREWARRWLAGLFWALAAFFAALALFPGLAVPSLQPGHDGVPPEDFLRVRRGAVFLLKWAGGGLALASASWAWFLGRPAVRALFPAAAPSAPANPPPAS